MELSFLGRGAAFNPLEGNTAAYLREADKLLLIDCGESVFVEIIRRKLLEGVKQVWIAVSHFHSDHCGSLGSLTLYCAQRLGFAANVLLPAHDERYAAEMRQLLRLFGVPDRLVCLLPESNLAGFSAFSGFRFVPTVHAPGMDCYSFEFETEGGGVYYTADTSAADGISTFVTTHPEFERIYAETVDAKESAVHLPLWQLAEIIPAEKRVRVQVMHLANTESVASAEKLGFRAVAAARN